MEIILIFDVWCLIKVCSFNYVVLEGPSDVSAKYSQQVYIQREKARARSMHGH